MKELEDRRMSEGMDPELHFTEFDAKPHILELVGIAFSEWEIVIILHTTRFPSCDTKVRAVLQDGGIGRHMFGQDCPHFLRQPQDNRAGLDADDEDA